MKPVMVHDSDERFDFVVVVGGGGGGGGRWSLEQFKKLVHRCCK